jgi:hypothetical protein
MPPPEEGPQGWETLFESADVVFVYTRAQAIADGVLVDVTKTAQEAGFVYPVAVTEALWRDIETIPPGFEQEDVLGRLWDVLIVGWAAIQGSSTDGDTLIYPVTLHVLGEEISDYPVKLVCGPGDNAEPVITLMKPGED